MPGSCCGLKRQMVWSTNSLIRFQFWWNQQLLLLLFFFFLFFFLASLSFLFLFSAITVSTELGRYLLSRIAADLVLLVVKSKQILYISTAVAYSFPPSLSLSLSGCPSVCVSLSVSICPSLPPTSACCVCLLYISVSHNCVISMA